MFSYVYIIFKYINQIVNFKQLKLIILYLNLFLVLKISYLYANHVMPLISFISLQVFSSLIILEYVQEIY